MGSFQGGTILSQAIPIFVTVFMVFVFGVVLFTVMKSLARWNQNNHSPVLTVNAKIVTKRKQISQNVHQGPNPAMNYVSSSASYYTTFEVESGDRMEFAVSRAEYGMLEEGYTGKLTFQGTRYLEFERGHSNV